MSKLHKLDPRRTNGSDTFSKWERWATKAGNNPQDFAINVYMPTAYYQSIIPETAKMKTWKKEAKANKLRFMISESVEAVTDLNHDDYQTHFTEGIIKYLNTKSNLYKNAKILGMFGTKDNVTKGELQGKKKHFY